MLCGFCVHKFSWFDDWQYVVAIVVQSSFYLQLHFTAFNWNFNGTSVWSFQTFGIDEFLEMFFIAIRLLLLDLQSNNKKKDNQYFLKLNCSKNWTKSDDAYAAHIDIDGGFRSNDIVFGWGQWYTCTTNPSLVAWPQLTFFRCKRWQFLFLWTSAWLGAFFASFLRHLLQIACQPFFTWHCSHVST